VGGRLTVEHALIPAIVLFAILVPSIGIPVFLGLRHERWKRSLEHEERMRALELGRPLPGDESWWSQARIGLMIAAGVPIGVFFMATLATGAAGFQEGIWIPAAVVSLAAVLCGSMVAGHSPGTDPKSVEQAAYKPAVEEDAYDVVSARG
jgi:hypothetical protein